MQTIRRWFYLLSFTLPLLAQQAPSDVEVPDTQVIFSVETVSRTTQAVNYERTGFSTKVDFVGTAEAEAAEGQAKIENSRSVLKLEIELKGLPAASSFGAEYLTYVVWAISPDGRATNLGEVLVNKNGAGKLSATTELQIFGMVVTAEPYFAVRQPSDVIVAMNEIRRNTRGKLYFIDAKFELLKRGQYEPLANPLALAVDLKAAPLELYEARNAVTIARSIGAAEFAPEVFKKAEASLTMAERVPKGDSRSRPEIVRTSRQAVQFAEDARALAVEREAQARLDAERQAAAEREAEARAKAENEAQRRAEAEAAQRAEEQARLRAEEQQAAAEKSRIEAERSRMEAELAAAREAAERAKAEAAGAEARAAGLRAEQEAARARQLAGQAEAEKLALRRRLLDQFNQALETRDTPRGLVVNLSDVLFDIGKADLRPITREKLARLSGICLAYPGLKLRAEGHTDSTGTDEINERLSLARAESVAKYVVSQGVPAEAVTSFGFGSTEPVASNDTREGRQQNRRVEIIVSGSVIGADVSTVEGNRR